VGRPLGMVSEKSYRWSGDPIQGHHCLHTRQTVKAVEGIIGPHLEVVKAVIRVWLCSCGAVLVRGVTFG
jgi:hypothetical protein